MRGRPRLLLVAAAMAGALTGLAGAASLPGPGAPEAPTPGPAVARAPAATAAPTPTPTDPGTTPPAPEVLLVWTAGGLPPDLAPAADELPGVVRSTLVRGDETRLVASWDPGDRPVDRPEPGWHIPLDTLAIEPATYAPFLPPPAAAAVGALRPGQALLTASSARLRGLDAGARIRLGDHDLTVAGTIPDADGAGAELLVTAADAPGLGVATERYLLLAHHGSRATLQRAVAARLGGRAVRFRTPAETQWLRHGDAVEPPLVLKGSLGEFAIREDGPGRDVEIDPAWVASNIATETLPILGPVTCHRDVLPTLGRAMEELEQAGLAHLVDPGAFAGCFAARRTGPGQPLSHHAWGAAVDLNVGGNPRGSFSTQDPRLVEVMTDRGFTWGGTWLVPDPAHYEAPLGG